MAVSRSGNLAYRSEVFGTLLGILNRIRRPASTLHEHIGIRREMDEEVYAQRGST
jgi:hypothetical protein